MAPVLVEEPPESEPADAAPVSPPSAGGGEGGLPWSDGEGGCEGGSSGEGDGASGLGLGLGVGPAGAGLGAAAHGPLLSCSVPSGSVVQFNCSSSPLSSAHTSGASGAGTVPHRAVLLARSLHPWGAGEWQMGKWAGAQVGPAVRDGEQGLHTQSAVCSCSKVKRLDFHA